MILIKMFVKPDKYDFHVTTQDAKNWAPKIIKEINNGLRMG